MSTATHVLPQESAVISQESTGLLWFDHARQRLAGFPLSILQLGMRIGVGGMSRALLKLSGSLVHDYATISDDSPSPNRASRARRAATSAGIS